MSTIKIQTEELKSEVLSHILKTTPSLDNAIEIASGFDVPSDFAYASFLNSMPTRVTDMNDRVKESRDWINDSIDLLVKTDEDLAAEAAALETTDPFVGANTGGETTDVVDTPTEETPPIDYSAFDTVLTDALNQANDDLAELEAELASLEAQYNRAKTMIGRGGMSDISLEELEALISTAEIKVNAKRKDIVQLESLKNEIADYATYQKYLELMNNEDFAKLTDLNNYKLTDEAYAKYLSELQNATWSSYDYSEGIAYFKSHPEVLVGIVELYDSDYLKYNEILTDLVNNFGTGLYLELTETLDWICVNKRYMSEEDYNIFIYILGTSGPDSAMEFANFVQEKVNLEIGRESADERIKKLEEIDDRDAAVKYFFQVTGYGLGDGVEQFFTGLGNLLGGADGVISPKDYETIFLMQYLVEKYGENSFMEGVYSVSSSIGNMVPSIIASIVSNYIAPGSGALVGSVLMGTSAAGNALESGLQMGMSYEQACLYGALTGISEAALQYFLGGIPGLSKLEKFAEMSGVTGFIAKMLSEGIEEGSQEILNSFFLVMCGQEFELDWTNVTKSAFYGMITAGIMNGAPIVVNGVKITVEDMNQIISQDISNLYQYIRSGIISTEILTKLNDPLVKKQLFKLTTAIENNDVAAQIDVLLDLGEEEKAFKLIVESADINSLGLTVDVINAIVHGDNAIGTNLLNNIYDRIVNNGEALTEETYNAIFTSEMFNADSTFAKEYVHSFLEISGSPELADLVTKTYADARTSTKDGLTNLYSYCDHTEAHVLQVAFLSMASLNVANEYSANTPGSKYLQAKNYKEIFIAGLCHDLGMAAGTFVGGKGKYYGVKLVNKFDGTTGLEVTLIPEMIVDKKTGNLIPNPDLADDVRNNHTINSALAVLMNRTYFENMGLNPDVIALLCFSHSKSNSGVGSLVSANDWSFAVYKIDEAVKLLKANHVDVNFNTSSFGGLSGVYVETDSTQKMDGKFRSKMKVTIPGFTFKDDFIGSMATKALALRVGDAYVSKAKIILNTPLKWKYNGVEYQTSMLVLTQSGYYMGYDASKTTSPIGSITEKNYMDYETSDQGAFIYFTFDIDGNLVPLEYEKNPSSYNKGNIEVSDKSLMGMMPIKLEGVLNKNKVKGTLTSNNYYLIDNKYYTVESIPVPGKPGVTTYEFHEAVGIDASTAGKPIKTSTGQFLVGESNVRYWFSETIGSIGEGGRGEIILSTYIIDNIEIFPYNTIDKGIKERVGEMATASDAQRAIDIRISPTQFAQHFEIVSGIVVAKAGSDIGKIYIDQLQAIKASDGSTDIGFTINGYGF